MASKGKDETPEIQLVIDVLFLFFYDRDDSTLIQSLELIKPKSKQTNFEETIVWIWVPFNMKLIL